MIIDITGPIREGMWTYGQPLPTVRIEQVANLEQEGWKGYRFELHSLAGTYLETADHLFPSRRTMDEIPVDRLFNRAWIAHLPDKNELEPITAEELITVTQGRLQPGDALLVSTGWDRYWDSEHFVNSCPYFTEEAMRWVVEQDVGLLGLDIPCVQDPRADDGTLNRIYFERERLLLAPLVGLKQADPGPWMLLSLPLRIPGVCGTPCRAVLMRSKEEKRYGTYRRSAHQAGAGRANRSPSGGDEQVRT